MTGLLDRILERAADIIGEAPKHNAGTVSFASGSSTRELKRLGTFSAGVWLITAHISFPSNSSGLRGLSLMINTTERARVIIPAINGLQSHLSTAYIVQGLSDMTVAIQAFQNSGSTMTVSWDYRAVKILGGGTI